MIDQCILSAHRRENIILGLGEYDHFYKIYLTSVTTTEDFKKEQYRTDTGIARDAEIGEKELWERKVSVRGKKQEDDRG